MRRLPAHPPGCPEMAWRGKSWACETVPDRENSPLQGYMAFLDALHVEAHGGNGATPLSALGPLVVVMVSWSCEAAELGQRWNAVAAGLRNVEIDIDVLDSELPSLDTVGQHRSVEARHVPYGEGTHRQNSQQRSLASILQTDHGDVHLGRPTRWRWSAAISGHRRTQLCFLLGPVSMRWKYQIAHQASRRGHRKMGMMEGGHTRTGAAASRRCDGRGSPWQSVGQRK
jgi:hypothetical protein